MKIILEAVVGSQAYGLATPESDIDTLGVFVAPTQDILGLFPVEETIKPNKDSTFHEVGKFIRLALKCNPSILELLYLPRYQRLMPEGRWLIANRDKFLSKVACDSYGGYAYQQFKKLKEHSGEYFTSSVRNRYSKHAKHLFRLLKQGKELITTGHLTVEVDNREELMEIGNLSPLELTARFENEYARFKSAECILPDKPDNAAVNEILLKIRRLN